jgi:CubicO group peptidase (beta-lactamase class C family)
VPGHLDELAARLVAAGPPGAVVAIGDECGVAGEAQRDAVAMSADVRTDAGSVTKILATTATLMALADAGELAVEDPAARYLPALYGHPATVADLLEHRAGLWEWWPLYLTATGPGAVDLIGRLPLRYPPGHARHYSDLGLILLGDLIERVTGQALEDAVTTLALRPFGLTTTSFRTPVAGAPVAASSYGDRIEQTMIATGDPYPVPGDPSCFARWRTHVLVGEINDGNAFHAFGGAAGHAGLFTTAADLIRFARGMLGSLAGDGPVSTPTARRFVTPGVDPVQALGFRRWGDVVGHTGFPGVAVGFDPGRDLAVAMITNRLHADGPPAATEQMWATVLQEARACG